MLNKLPQIRDAVEGWLNAVDIAHPDTKAASSGAAFHVNLPTPSDVWSAGM